MICPWSDYVKDDKSPAIVNWVSSLTIQISIPQTSYRILTAFRDTNVAVFTQECLSFRTETTFSYSIARTVNKAGVRGTYIYVCVFECHVFAVKLERGVWRRSLCQIQGRRMNLHFAEWNWKYIFIAMTDIYEFWINNENSWDLIMK